MNDFQFAICQLLKNTGIAGVAVRALAHRRGAVLRRR